MFIDIKDIVAKGKKVAGKLNLGTLPWQSKENIEVSDATFEVFFQWGEKGLYVRGKAHLAVALNCSRCLERFATSIDSEFHFNLKEKSHQSETGDKPLDEEEINVFPIEGSLIDMREILSELIYLNIPLKPLCKHDCHGLCSVCGGNLNNDGCICSDRK